MGRQLSTSVSDFFLASASYYAAFVHAPSNDFVCYGLTIVAIAATLGVFRFAGLGGSPLLFLHTEASKMGGGVGYPLIAAGFVLTEMQWVQHAAMTLCVVTVASEMLGIWGIMSSLVPGVSMLTILTFTFPVNPVAVGACVAFFMAAGVGVDGKIGGIYKVDIFHYLLVVANIGFAMGAPVPGVEATV